jgi:glutamate synthase domain-containing protein 3
MFFVAEEMRQIMAELGFRTVKEMVGHCELLEFADVSSHWKAKSLDLSVILHKPALRGNDTMHNTTKQDHGLDESLDNTKLIKLAEPVLAFSPSLGIPASGEQSRTGEGRGGGISAFSVQRSEFPQIRATLPIRNVNRTVGTTLSGLIAKKLGQGGLPDDTIHFKFEGSAGQSFGCFLAHGVTLEIEGDANDYLGKGLSGGRIIAYPPKAATFKPEENIIAGNVICYGAIAGEVYLRGIVGERFCVRNSGVKAVVEGVGDHACEYMTGGRVIVLGPTGRNFAAGMSGGIAYVYDDRGLFKDLCNTEMVELEGSDTFNNEDIQTLRTMLENHARYTGSTRAKSILDNWEPELRWFVKVMPTDYRRVMEHQAEINERARQLAERQTAGT